MPVQLLPAGDTWTWDAGAFDRAAAGARVLLLVNPQNPTGRSFRRDELVHEPHRHVPFATLAPERTVTITSATKAYNIAGVRTAVAHVGPSWLRERWDAQPPRPLRWPE